MRFWLRQNGRKCNFYHFAQLAKEIRIFSTLTGYKNDKNTFFTHHNFTFLFNIEGQWNLIDQKIGFDAKQIMFLGSWQNCTS